MTAPSKVHPSVPSGAGSFRSAGRPRKFPVSDGAPVEIVETGVSLMARLASLGCRVTIRPALGVCSYVPHLPWPFGLLDFVSRAFVPTADTVRATIGLPNADAQLVRSGCEEGLARVSGEALVAKVCALSASMRMLSCRSVSK